MTNRLPFPICAFSLLVFAAPASAADIPVGPGQSIQTAIAQAANGDRVLVAPGTYAESIDFLGKDIEVIGIGGPAATILDGAGAAVTLVTFGVAEPPTALFEGFTVRNGRTGVWVKGTARPTLRHVISEGHHTFGTAGVPDGVGFALLTSFVLPTRVEECIARDNDGRGLTGIFLAERCVVTGNRKGGVGMSGWSTLRECRISDNTADEGGGIVGVEGTIERCVIANNTATKSGGGISSLGSSTSLVLRGCEIYGNHAAQKGGGVYLSTFYDYEDAGFNTITLEDCLIHDNAAAEAGGAYLKATKLWNGHPGTAYVRRTTFANNTPSGIAGIVKATQLTDCLFWEQPTPISLVSPSSSLLITAQHCDIQGGWAGIGNINVDPRFVDPSNGDYRLQHDSPCIEAGVGGDVYDFEGDTTAGVNDIGGDEFKAHLSVANLVTSAASMTLDVIGEPGASVLLFASPTRPTEGLPTPFGIPTPYGYFGLGFPLFPGFPLPLGLIPAGSKLSLTATLPAIPAGTPLHFQAFVDGTTQALTPAITVLVN